MDTNNPMGHAMVDTDAGKGIGAGIDKVKQLGGRVVLEPVQTGPVTIARFADPEGNIIGLAKGM